MILGVHPQKQRLNHEEELTLPPIKLSFSSNNKAKWNRVTDGSISVPQMKRNWEIAHRLFNKDCGGNTNTNTNETTRTRTRTRTEVMTVSMPSKTRKIEPVNVPEFITSLDNGSTLQVKHVIENWNKQNWLQRHVHSAIKESMLSSIIVDCKWFVTNTQTDTQSCGIDFFKTILPHLSEQLFLDKNACICLPMHPWYFIQLCLHQKTLEEWHVVDFVKETALDKAHGAWFSDEKNKDENVTHFHNLGDDHEFAAAKDMDGFLGKMKMCVKQNGVKKCMRSFADGFFQLDDEKFMTVKWICLRQCQQQRW